ncbi:transposase [Endozoicomonas sp. SCSIO W0465]|uniref:transposase n=1 Tax=Endozoicomonas sp. SCSIO W0465 TaxID=2918516 RepID=UPI0020758F8B|nr:transposase [Endozoicomonas sp. SCSIO W0465]USE37888.1 transposase [Endozoicomonas sp. SCSIO W0465]
MTKQRKNYSPEFKRKAIAMVVEQKQAVTEVARSLGINDGNLRRWIREQDEKKEMSFPGKGQQALTPDQQRIKELEAEHRQLKMEQEILKKATAFFAKDLL